MRHGRRPARVPGCAGGGIRPRYPDFKLSDNVSVTADRRRSDPRFTFSRGAGPGFVSPRGRGRGPRGPRPRPRGDTNPGPAPRENVKRGSLRLRSAVTETLSLSLKSGYRGRMPPPAHPGTRAGRRPCRMRLRYVGGDPDLTRIPHPERYEHPHPETEPPAPLRSATPRS